MIKAYLEDAIQRLTISPAISSFTIIRMDAGEEDGYIRAKCGLSNGDFLEYSEYIVIRDGKIQVETYSFHWQTANGELRKRWDNVPHFKDLETFPDHLHLPTDVIESSPKRLKEILAEIEEATSIETG